MLKLYCHRNGQVVVQEANGGDAVPDGLVWADLLEPSVEEVAYVSKIARIEVPTPEEMREIEPSSRLYREGAALFMTASVLNNTETAEPETRAITFVLLNMCLVTIRYASPLPFKTFHARLQSRPELCVNPQVALIELVDAIVDRIADTLEAVDINFGQLSKAIFPPLEHNTISKQNYTNELRSIGLNAIRCSKADESLVGFSRLLTFLDTNVRAVAQKMVRVRIKDLQRDIISLMGYVERMSEKLQMLLDATLGMINIQQNNIIKIFSVIAVIFLPPTLVASIYGMNFHYMPEVNLIVGYPMALLLMLFSAVGPYMYFRYRGWL